MHASAELLARLAPKICSMSPGHSGHGNLQTIDLAAALSGLPPGPYALARVAWVDDRAGWRELTGLVLARLRVGPSWEGVIALAVAEYAWPPRCRECFGRCFGRGEIKVGAAPSPYNGRCPACHGSGYGRVPLASLADACGVSSEEWKRVWAARYERVFRLVSGWGGGAEPPTPKTG